MAEKKKATEQSLIGYESLFQESPSKVIVKKYQLSPYILSYTYIDMLHKIANELQIIIANRYEAIVY